MADKLERPRSVESLHGERERRLQQRYGGFSWGSDFIGFVVASFFTLVFFGIVGAIIGGVGYQLGAPVPKVGGSLSPTSHALGIGGLAGALVALALAYFLGGYTAGRMARFDGVKNGLGVVLWAIVVGLILGIVGAVLGTRFNVASQLHLAIDAAMLTIAGVVSLAVTLIVMAGAAALGGRMGAEYHRKIDRAAGLGAGQAGVSDTADSGSEPARQGGGMRDKGDVIEVPIVEEELVKRPVVKEVLRVRKDQVAEQQTVEANLRKEDVEIAQDGDVVAGGDT